MALKKIFVIIGPTASGKSGLALKLAKNGCVVNADSMQIYRDLTILSARPTAEEMQGIPHLLYGYADVHHQGTVRDWLDRVVPVLAAEENPVLVGGTGLYISALINGINQIPDIPDEVRRQVRGMDLDTVREQVRDCPYTDPQRMRRALEVQLTTGKSLAYFQSLPKERLFEADFRVIFINPPREKLYQNCAKRFDQMMAAGAVDEVRHLMTLNPTGGVLKAIGVPEIRAYLDGKINEAEMKKQVVLATRHYAKRQITWFRHQIKSDLVLTDPTGPLEGWH